MCSSRVLFQDSYSSKLYLVCQEAGASLLTNFLGITNTHDVAGLRALASLEKLFDELFVPWRIAIYAFAIPYLVEAILTVFEPVLLTGWLLVVAILGSATVHVERS